MKLCCAVAVALLVLTLCSQGQSNPADAPDECCFSFYSKTIPVSKIKSYQETHAGCPKKGVVLTTVTDKKICVNPEVKLAQDIMEKVDNLFGTQTLASSR